MNLFYHTIHEDTSTIFECQGWKKCIISNKNKHIINNPIIEKSHQILRLRTIINSIIYNNNNINNILIIGDGYAAPTNNIEHWQYYINNVNEICIYYKYCSNHRNEFSQLFKPYNIINIAIPGSGFIKETSIIHQLNYAYNCTNINNFYYDAILLVKCHIFNKLVDQDPNDLIELSNLAKKCLINNKTL